MLPVVLLSMQFGCEAYGHAVWQDYFTPVND